MGGISIYWHEISSRLKHTKEVKVLFFDNNISANKFSALYHNSHIIKAGARLPLQLKRYLDPSLTTSAPGIFHSSYYRIPKNKKNLKVVTTVHDFTYEKYANGPAKWVHAWQKHRAIKKSDVVICVSASTKNDLLHFYPEFREKDIRVVYNGVSNEYFPISQNIDALDDAALLYVGSRASYKNFLFTIELLEKFKKYKLRIVGPPLNENEQQLLTRKIPNRFTVYTGISNSKLNVLYNSSLCLLYPSYYEGFGIPVLEAMKAKCPVLTLNNSSLPEVCGEAGLMLSSLNFELFGEALDFIEKNRKELVNKGLVQVQKFSWEKCYQETLEIYKEFNL